MCILTGHTGGEAASEELGAARAEAQADPADASEGGDGRGAARGGLPAAEDREQPVPGAHRRAQPGPAEAQADGREHPAGPQLVQGQGSIIVIGFSIVIIRHTKGHQYYIHFALLNVRNN